MVSVVIPCYNESGYIKQCVESVLNGSHKDIEVLVVDGGSLDGSVAIVQSISESDGRVKLLHNPRKITPLSLNIGIQNASGDFICILGAHAEPASDWIEKSIVCLNNHPEAIVSGGLLETVNENFWGRAISLAMSSRFGVGGVNFRVGGKEGPVDTVPFGCYRINAFKKYGLFDESLATNQDDDFNLRLVKNREIVYFDPSISCRYYSRSSPQKLLNQYWRYGFYKFAVLFRNKKVGGIRQLIPGLSVGTFILCLLVSPFWPFMIDFLKLLSIVYIFLALVFTIVSFGKDKKASLLFPIVCFAIHVVYGSGFILGTIAYFFQNNKTLIPLLKQS